VDGALALPPLSATAALGTLLGEGLLAVPDRDGGILGWYRSHVFGDAALTPGDADAHLKYFRDDFQLCLVIAGSGAGGGWFRPAAGVAWQFDCLPFHEVLSDVSLRATGARPSVVGWRNYRTSDAVVRKRMSTAVDAATVAKGSQAVLLPVEDDGDDAPPAASPARRAASARGAWRQAAYVVAAAVGALGTYAVLAMRAPERDAGGVAGSAALAPLQRLDLQADTLEIALAAFDLRARMFEARQMRCDDLARGLVQLEEQWLAYNVARRGRPAGMDEGRAEQARAAHERVEEAERRFERSRCARP
jgi:hypothetical protein